MYDLQSLRKLSEVRGQRVVSRSTCAGRDGEVGGELVRRGKAHDNVAQGGLEEDRLWGGAPVRCSTSESGLCDVPWLVSSQGQLPLASCLLLGRLLRSVG